MKPHYDLILVDSDRAAAKELERVFQSGGFSSLSFDTGHAALEAVQHTRFSVMVLNSNLPDVSAFQVLEWLAAVPIRPETIVLSDEADAESAVKALKLGAFDYVTKPAPPERLLLALRQALEKCEILRRMEVFSEDAQGSLFETIVGKSPKMQAIYELIRQVSGSTSNVLIQGPSGTGKELVAKAIHRNGPRRDAPFIVINCAAMPETLLESELFGYVKGSFTGANADKTGLFEAASKGTVFLDEIGEVPLGMQVKLLRVLQEGEIRRIGENAPRKVDVRIMAATNRDLVQMIREGTFREDLYYRLNVINIQLPTLKERSEDVLLLANHFLKQVSERMGRSVGKISIDAVQALQNYSWPGNVRELENVIERAVVFAEGDSISAKNLPAKILSTSFYNLPDATDDLAQLSYKDAKKRALNIFNRSYIIGLLDKVGGNITAASEKAGLDRSNFKKIIKKYRIETKA